MQENDNQIEKGFWHMILSDGTIRELIEEGDLSIDPFDASLVQPASIDVRLGDNFMTCLPGASNPVIETVGQSADNFLNYQKVTCTKQRPFFYLYPQQFVLGTTLERVGIPDDIIARLDGKSSLGRIGLMVHITAGYIDPGFIGCITLELLNVTNRPIKLIPGMKIGQLAFETLDKPAQRPYGTPSLGSHYQNQSQATPADFRKLC